MRPLKIATAHIPDHWKAALEAASRWLTDAEEHILILRIRQGDAAAIEELVNAWERIILRCALSYGVYEADRVEALCSAGRAGLRLCALQEVGVDGDISRSRLLRFGVWWVRQGMGK